MESIAGVRRVEPIIVGIGECRVEQKPGRVLATYGLGSCIAVAVHDPVAGVGGLLHFMLPDSGIDPKRRLNPARFADTGVALLLREVMSRGGAGERLVIHAAGGARVTGAGEAFEIGKRNYEALLRALSLAALRLDGEDIGGAAARNLHLEIGTGRVWTAEPGFPAATPGWPHR